MNYKPTIGLEVHAELATKTKMFCDCKNDFDEPKPNINVCPICMGHPGTLPVINKKAVEMVIKTGLALGSKISEETFFERKNYFYPDLPKGYQISQYQIPLCSGGYLHIKNEESEDKKIRIHRVHLEEDTGKLIHPDGSDYSLVDFNRAGVPLMELVTEPDIFSAKEAGNFARELQLILRYLGVSKADMEKGQMRVEVNISLSPDDKLGTKVEIKNLNSIRSVERSIEFEVQRQTEALNNGGKLIQETRGWHDFKQITFSQREKEESHDYRYFPEPDLPPIKIESADIKKIKAELPELPQQKGERFKKEYNLPEEDIKTFIKQRKLAEYFEDIISELKVWCEDEEIPEDQVPSVIKMASNYLQTDLLGILKTKKIKLKDLKISPENFAELITILWKGEVSSRAGKDILAEMIETGIDPTYIIGKKDLKIVSDTTEIEQIAKKIIEQNPKAVGDYNKGKENALQFLVGGIMRETKGKLNPEEARKIIAKLLDK
jgi:aspartyl-tRNA(Asn)/glutamyl-tRNA(Gln) amidotransferase subunit B